MKKRFYWSYRRFGTAPKYEFWLRGEDGLYCRMAIFCPTYRSYSLILPTEIVKQTFPEQIKTSEVMKKYVETLLRLKGLI